MIPLQNDKTIQLFHAASATAAGTVTSTYVDASGYEYAEFIVLAATAGTTGAIPASVAIQHSDTTNTSDFATISGASATTSTTGYITALPTTAGTVPIARVGVNLLGKKRYLRLALTGPAANSCTVSAAVALSRASQSPTGTNVGASVAVNVG